MIPLVFAALLASQAPSPPQPPQTFRSGTDVVEVDVRVFKDGRFVMDLGPDDFVLTEDGAPQKIQSVVLVGAQAASAHPSAPETPLAAHPAAPLAPAASAAPAVWLFLFDSNHLSAGGLQRTREAVVKFVAERWRQGDIGGVVVDGKMANNRLTTDREELRAAAQAVKMPGDTRSRQIELTRDWPRIQDEGELFRLADNDRETMEIVVTRACVDDPDYCKRGSPDVEVREKANRLIGDIQRDTMSTLTTVGALANGLARLPGQKTVVFLSEGFVAEKLESQVRQAVGLAARAGARFYALDARGLNKGAQATMIDQLAAESTISGGGPHFDLQTDAPNSLAVDTGGFAIRNENNFGRALDEIQQDAGTYYLIAYSPAKAAFDGKYRTIAVNVARPGVKVRARRGYVALPPARITTDTMGPAGPKGATAATDAPPRSVAPVPVAPAPPAPAAPEAPHPTEPVGGVTPTVAPSPASASASLARLAPTGPSATDSPAAVAGWGAYQRGDVESAARTLATAAAAPDARPWVHYALGLSRYALQRYHDAAEAWERVRRAVPEFEPVYFSLADAYGQQHDEGTAIKTLRDAEQRWPQDPEVSDAIGVIQVRRGALDAAIESFERATTVGPADALGYFNLARAHQMRLAKSQRYDQFTQKWIGGDEDRRRAIANFERYVELGGPYERQAKEALAALSWK
ncbi:MAG TPA: VWA domain-containing protein [Vicinamibacterales bacterium]|nr:VWA domain-containing protein [Vicinamibacterales bacterium]